MKTIRIILVLIGLSMLIGAGFYVANLIKHAQPIPAGAVSMDYPLKNGKFWVVQAGKNGKIHASPSEKYALDITKYPTLKTWFRFRQTKLEQDPSFGTPIFTPCAGTVIKSVRGFPDVPIGVNGKGSETNFVIVRCENFSVQFVHFKQNSVQVNEGDQVLAGQEIGLMGNSGNSSGPHLHLAAFKKDPQTGEAINVPITFNGQYFYRGDNFTN